MSRTLALHDGRAGNARQALALARALDPHAGEHVLQPSWWARRLAPRCWPGIATPFGPGFRTLHALPPRYAIGCGRQAALATRLLRQRGSRAVQVLDPRIDPRHWDVVVVPSHDLLRGDNVLPMIGSLHPVDDDWLLRAISAFPSLAMLPTPHSVLLVGGPTRHAALDDARFATLVQQLAAQALTAGGSFSAIASRRTPTAWRSVLHAVPRNVPGLRWRDTGDGPNPYAGLLANADCLIATPDSVNMLSEAAATYAPLYIAHPECAQGRLQDFLHALLDTGRARALGNTLTSFEALPLRETPRVAAEVRKRLQH